MQDQNVDNKEIKIPLLKEEDFSIDEETPSLDLQISTVEEGKTPDSSPIAVAGEAKLAVIFSTWWPNPKMVVNMPLESLMIELELCNCDRYRQAPVKIERLEGHSVISEDVLNQLNHDILKPLQDSKQIVFLVNMGLGTLVIGIAALFFLTAHDIGKAVDKHKSDPSKRYSDAASGVMVGYVLGGILAELVIAYSLRGPYETYTKVRPPKQAAIQAAIVELRQNTQLQTSV